MRKPWEIFFLGSTTNILDNKFYCSVNYGYSCTMVLWLSEDLRVTKHLFFIHSWWIMGYFKIFATYLINCVIL